MVVDTFPVTKEVAVAQAVGPKNSRKSFLFDGVYDESTTQQQLFESAVAPIVNEV